MNWGMRVLSLESYELEPLNSGSLPKQPPLWVVFKQGRVQLSEQGELFWLNKPAVDAVQQHNLGLLDGHVIYALELPADEERSPDDPKDGVTLRSLILHDEAPGYLLHHAASLLNWGSKHRFCPSCATPFSIPEEEQGPDRARACHVCNFRAYPSVSPCIIVLIHKGDDVLLARGLHHPPGFHSLIAGFVEPGESLEQAVAREVLEETGLKVADIEYQHSQPWPFPHNLMMGFTARYVDGDIKLDTQELAEAGWHPLSNLPTLPPPQTIATQLVEKFILDKQK